MRSPFAWGWTAGRRLFGTARQRAGLAALGCLLALAGCASSRLTAPIDCCDRSGPCHAVAIWYEGKLTLALPACQPDKEEVRCAAWLQAVKDSGIGFASEDMGKLRAECGEWLSEARER